MFALCCCLSFSTKMKRFIMFLLLSSICCGLLIKNAFAIDMNKEECELHAPDTMHEFCCDIHDENSEFMECEIEWTKKITQTTEVEEMSYKFCVSECVFNKTGYLGADRKSLLMGSIKLHLNDIHAEEESEKIMYETYEKCAKHAEHMLQNAEVKKLEPRLSEHGCHPYPGLVFECVSNELILNCPKDKYHGTASCDHIREYLQACLKHK